MISKGSDHTINIYAKNIEDYNLLKELGMIEETETEETYRTFSRYKKSR